MELCNAILQAENPAIAASADCLLTLAAVLPELHLHTVCKEGNPYRQDPLTLLLQQYWQSAADLGHAAEDMLLNFVVVIALRSQQLAEYLVQNFHVHFSTPDVLPGLYRLGLKAGSSRLGDASTSATATACLSLGTLVDSILLPYWSKKETHVVYQMVHCRAIADAFQLLLTAPYFSDLALAHVSQYLSTVDRRVGRLSSRSPRAWPQQVATAPFFCE